MSCIIDFISVPFDFCVSHETSELLHIRQVTKALHGLVPQ